MKNPFIPHRLHDMLILLKDHNSLKEIKYSIDHDMVKAVVIDKFGHQYLYIDGFSKGFRFKRRIPSIVEVEQR